MPKMNPQTGIPKSQEDRMMAAIDLLRRTGMEEFQIRFCEEELPVVWIAAGRWDKRWEFGAARTPWNAVYSLCDEVVDGGTCTHCHRPTGFLVELDLMPDILFCWYQYDPGSKKFIRSCAGGDTG